ncbi:MAG: DUF2141 domain-containing protein [Nitrospinaceae bacterium]|nr:hypothetical protein [Nitrospinota bacterium]MDP6334955.1 DUF2141 domain-containing protein [Nitrospinaceae bacterium]HAX46854.1 hypothetical protein [Nitrospina sp.]MBV51263.1 hypothetical protein [Nitrospinota bacterium]MDP7148615.1 DUF2141 domain-containing protein [Nitrospinaceae bacterium]
MQKRIFLWVGKAMVIACLLTLALPANIYGQQGTVSSKMAGKLVIMASGFKSGGGQFIVNVFATEAGYPLDSSQAVRTYNGDVTHETMEIQLEEIAFGTYAVTVLHDEDKDGKMTTGFLGMPKEAIGISNNPRSYFGAPAYEDALFKINQIEKTIAIALHSH